MKLFPDKQTFIKNQIRKEWNQFVYHTMLLEKEKIMDMCDKIYFYDCVVEYFQENEHIPLKIILFLLHKENIIHNLWLLYLKYDHLDFSTWTNLEGLLKCWMLEN